VQRTPTRLVFPGDDIEDPGADPGPYELDFDFVALLWFQGPVSYPLIDHYRPK
jgi:hypothetical protein